MARDSSSGETAAPALTEHAELHGCSCKVGQGELDDLLSEAGLFADQEGLLFGVGEDAAAMPVTDGTALVSTIDFFTPVVDSPYDFGRIAACNAASDSFAKGAIDRLSALVVLGLPRDLTDAAEGVLRGIVDAIEGVEGVVAGGHTVLNPWPLAGCAITALASRDALMTTQTADPGDRLYLTKPLGTQPAMGAVRVREGEFGEEVRAAAPRSIGTIGHEAIEWMTTPNRAAAAAARDAGVTVATDVTGFGLLGQARVLADRSDVGIRLTDLPIIAGTGELSRLFGYGLDDGMSAETSGGLLLAVPPERRQTLEAALADHDVFYREVGYVTDGTDATLEEPTIENVDRG